MKAKVLIRPKEGILDPQGKAVERALPTLGFEGVSHVRVGRLVELETDDPDALPELCEKLLANPLIEDFEVVDRSADEVGGAPVPRLLRRARRAARLLAAVGEARLVWHEEHRPRRARRGRRPRRLLLRRLPAGRRDRPLLAGDGGGGRVRRGRRPRARDLQRLPGPLRGGAAARRAARQRARCASSAARSTCIVESAASAVHARRRRRASRSRSRSSTPSGRYFAPDDELDRLEAEGQVAFRYAPGHNPNGSARDIAGVVQRARQRARPDAAPRARRRPADRLRGRPEAVRSAR